MLYAGIEKDIQALPFINICATIIFYPLFHLALIAAFGVPRPLASGHANLGAGNAVFGSGVPLSIYVLSLSASSRARRTNLWSFPGSNYFSLSTFLPLVSATEASHLQVYLLAHYSTLPLRIVFL